MSAVSYTELASDMVDCLGLSTIPLAITFLDSIPVDIDPFTGQLPAPTADGRTGRVPAGCVFWMKAENDTFSTIAEDHGNCSVGSMTHGFKLLEDIAANADVAALLDSGWVSMDAVPNIPVITERPSSIVYGPLAESKTDPDIVFLRINGKQAMILSDAWPDIQFEGKPQCHIIPIAKEQNKIAISVGCMLSRVRTGMSNNEMTCAIPVGQLQDLVARLRETIVADKAVATYASEDKRRFV